MVFLHIEILFKKELLDMVSRSFQLQDYMEGSTLLENNLSSVIWKKR